MHKLRVLTVAGQQVEIDAPGLDIRGQGANRRIYWVCPKRGRRANFRPFVQRLHYDLESHADIERMAEHCRSLYGDMLTWLSDPNAANRVVYDGTLKSLLDVWQQDPESPWHSLRANTQRSYEYSISVLERYKCTARRIDRLTGKDLRRWHSQIMQPPGYDGPPKKRAADMAVRELMRAALAYGMELGRPECGALMTVLTVMRFKAPMLTKDERVEKTKLPMAYEHAEKIVALGLAKGEKKWRSIALGVAAQFEFTLRQIDVIGSWEAIKRFAPKGAIVAGKKWWRPGLRFEDIGTVLKLATSKNDTDVIFEPGEYPLFQRAFEAVPEAERSGPLCVTNDDLPFFTRYYADLFRQLATEAEVPEDIWNARARHGGLTEGYEAIIEKHGEGSAALNDLRFHGQHNDIETTFGHYIRPGAAPTTRVAKLRVEKRSKKGAA